MAASVGYFGWLLKPTGAGPFLTHGSGAAIENQPSYREDPYRRDPLPRQPSLAESNTAAAFNTNADKEEDARSLRQRWTHKSALNRTGQAAIAPRVRTGNPRPRTKTRHHRHRARRNAVAPLPYRCLCRRLAFRSVQATGQPPSRQPGCYSPGTTARICATRLHRQPSASLRVRAFGP